MNDEIARFVRMHDDVQMLMQGVVDLVEGRLTHRLIHPEAMESAVSDMIGEFRRGRGSPKMLYYKVAKDVYASGNYDYARHGHDVFVRIRLPYTTTSRLPAYQTVVIPMGVTGRQNLVTELKQFPKLLVTGAVSTKVGELQEIPSSGIVDMGKIKWHRLKSNACAFHVFNDNPERVQQFCEFVASKQITEPQII